MTGQSRGCSHRSGQGLLPVGRVQQGRVITCKEVGRGEEILWASHVLILIHSSGILSAYANDMFIAICVDPPQLVDRSPAGSPAPS